MCVDSRSGSWDTDDKVVDDSRMSGWSFEPVGRSMAYRVAIADGGTQQSPRSRALDPSIPMIVAVLVPDMRVFQLRDAGAPMMKTQNMTGMSDHRGRPAAGEGMPNILVVDDDPMVRKAIEIYLERHNFEVVVADGGEAGLRALEDGAFDLMIVDIFMPHMRGFESIRIFHERAPTVPLIAMSGYAFANLNSPAPDFLRMALELGASRCLRKPFTPATLQAMIDECLAEAQSRRSGIAQLR